MLKGPANQLTDTQGDRKAPVSVKPGEDMVDGHGTVARNAVYLMLGQVVTTALAIVFSAALGRNLGASDFGLYFLIASFTGFAYVLVDWGQQLYMMREVARQPSSGSNLLGTALVLRVVGAALVAVPSVFVLWTLGYDETTFWYSVAFIAVSLPFFLAQGYGIVFRARERMGLDAWVSVANKIALVGLALVALGFGAGLPGVLVAQTLAGFVALALAIRLYRQVTTGPLRYSSEIARQILMLGLAPLAFNALNNVQPYIDAVLLSKLAPGDVVGWYGAAKNIMNTMLMPALIIGMASFPRITRAAANEDTHRAEVRAALRPIMWLGALAAVGTFLFADDVIAIMYGEGNFVPSGIILKVYAPGFFLLFVSVLFGVALFSLDREKAFTILKVTSVAICTVLELVLIPIFQERTGNGGIGVVVAFVISEIVLVAGAMYMLRQKCLGSDILIDMARALGAASVTLAFFWWLPPLPFLIGVPVCIIVYLLCSIGLGLIQRSDVQVFKALLRK
ncbi:MAG: flippase, partial [Alphaproteobacteria bacterium]